MHTSLAVEAPERVESATERRWQAVLSRPIILILVFQVLESLILLHNTAFEDEALYIHAGTELLRSLAGGPRPPADYATFFSGYPYFYPLLAGVLNHFGGVIAVRLFSMACMLVTTACVYWITRQLFTRNSGIAAALLFACAGPTLFLSQFATFDSLSLMLIALAVTLALQAATAGNPAMAVRRALLIVPLLVLAVAAKYAALLFVPFVIALLAAQAFERRGWRHARLLVGVTVAALGIVVVGALILMPPDVRAGLSFTTTNRTALIRTPDSYLLTIITSLGGLIWALGLIGLAFSPKLLRLTASMLLLASLAAPAYHLYIGESVSLHKHVDFGLFFAAPLAGYTVSALITSFVPRLQTRVTVLLLIFVVAFAMGVHNVLWWYHGWPDTTQMVGVVRTELRGANGRYLSDDYEILQYYLDGLASDTQYTGPYFFQYTDTHGNRLSGEAAYTAAVKAGYFDVIELNYPHGMLSTTLGPIVETQPQYHLIAKVPYTDSYGTGYYLVWSKSSQK